MFLRQNQLSSMLLFDMFLHCCICVKRWDAQ